MAEHKKEFDEVTGMHTTGHVWDGDIKELNRPLPRWWLYTFYVCILWSVGYWIAYPAWPLAQGYTKGLLGYSQRTTVTEQVAAARAQQAGMRSQLEKASLAEARSKPDLLQFATTGGKAVFADNCAPCHGRGAQGGNGYPNLNDDDWIWGGSLEAIEQTIQHGIRWSADDDTRVSDMPTFGIDQILQPKQISDVAEYVLSLSGKSTDAAAAEAGKAVFAENCTACHGEDGKGNQELGAPNLSDALWLYGSDKASVLESIKTGRGGQMPAWIGRLDPSEIKSLALYVHSLGGGK